MGLCVNMMNLMVWSSVFDLKNLMIYRAEGDPRKKKFVVDSRLHDVVQRK